MDLIVFDNTSNLDVSINPIFNQEGVQIFELIIKSAEAIVPKPVTIQWKIPAHNVKGVWKPTTDFEKRIQADWELEHLESRISIDAPIISLFGNDDTNVHTFACSNAINKLELNARIREEDDCFYCHITFLSERLSPLNEFKAQIRIDSAPKHFSTALNEVAAWWETFDNLKPAFVPQIAKTPLYSTWYNFHQNLEVEKLLAECRIAYSLGYKVIIIDDGWQTNDTNRGYDYTGDWTPDRISKTKEFVDAVHEIGMKVGFWYSVPFCGVKSRAYKVFENKLLTKTHRWAPVFDPRFPEVREYLINIYKNALQEWGLDGFKLDFIDDFRLYDETVLTDADGRDYSSINEAVDRLLSDVMTELKAINPDVFIEFRQRYTGPAMRKFGNMMRAFDCPGDGTMNRVRIADIRMLCGDTAVHADMLTWHKDEKVEIAALQVVNTLFGVPQLSVMLQDMPQDHIDMIQFYTKYWNDNANVLMQGKFVPSKPLANYPIQQVTKGDHQIIGLYDEYVVSLATTKKYIDIINGQLATQVVLDVAADFGTYNCKVYDCKGTIFASNEITLNQGLYKVDVPACGLIQLTLKN